MQNKFHGITEDDLNYFKLLLSEKFVFTDTNKLSECSADHTEDFCYTPEVVLQPATVAEVSNILKHCNQRLIPVTPRGAGTGLSGGALPVFGGVVLDMKRFDKILNLDVQNFQITTEPGVITQLLQEHVLEYGLMYPPDPSSKGSCFIGGNVSENAGGPRAVKYGVVKDYVLNLEVVLPTGEVIWTGANVLKNATGYNLTNLVVGSEGTLGVITKIVLRLLPAVKHDVLLLVPFRSAEQASEAVNKIFLSGHTPSALEFMDREAIALAISYVQDSPIQLKDDIQAHLLIELDGNDPNQLYSEADSLTKVLSGFDVGDILFADSNEQKRMLWNLRRKIGEAVKSRSAYKEEDTVVPRANLPSLLTQIRQIAREFGFSCVCYGHAGDGNLHVNILKNKLTDYEWNEKLPLAIERLFCEVIKLGGTISGEHGIGFSQKNYIHIAISEVSLNLMRSIKLCFDPNNILNPGKIFPDAPELKNIINTFPTTNPIHIINN